MLGLLIAAAAAAQTPVLVNAEVKPVLPPSLRDGALAACAPTTLEAAEDCLTKALSSADLAILRDRIPSRQFRPSLDCQMQKEWRLNDRNSPMARVMREKLGIHHPHLATGMIISDLQARAAGGRVPFDEMRQALIKSPPPPSTACERLARAQTGKSERGNAN
jgi:hypothetical protein